MTRRLATVFVDIAGSTRLVVRHPPETVLGVVQCFMTLVSDVALRHRGRVKDFEGDGVLLYFDSVSDATEAALAIRAALDGGDCESGCGGGPGASARVSVTVGDVAVGTVGPSQAHGLAIVGPSVNLGARLLRTLPPGGIVADAGVVAALSAEGSPLAARFRVLDDAFEIPGADGLTITTYAVADAVPAGDVTSGR